MRQGFGVVMGLLLGASVAHAQLLPTEYRLTRTTTVPQGQTAPAPVAVTFLRTAMTCNLAVADPPPGALRIQNPAATSTDCEWRDTAGAIIQRPTQPGWEHRFTLAGRIGSDPWSPESGTVIVRLPAVPDAPPNFRLTPPQGVSLVGRVLRDPYQFGGMEVAEALLDLGARFYFGAPTGLAVDGFRVRQGDRMMVSVWR